MQVLQRRYDTEMADIRKELVDVRQRNDDVWQENLLLRQRIEALENDALHVTRLSPNTQKGKEYDTYHYEYNAEYKSSLHTMSLFFVTQCFYRRFGQFIRL